MYKNVRTFCKRADRIFINLNYLVPLYYNFFVCIFIMPCFFIAHSCFHAYNRSFLHFKFSKTIYKKALWTQWPVVGVMLLIIRITVQVIAEKVMIGAHFEEKIRYIHIYMCICTCSICDIFCQKDQTIYTSFCLSFIAALIDQVVK